MKLLLIDTANQSLSVSVTDGLEILAEFNSAIKVNHSLTLMPTIEYVLNYAGLTVKDLDGIAVSEGPGSYTGLRIGVTVAKTLAYTNELPLYSVSSLKAIAATVRMHEFLLVPVIDARRGAVYAGIYRFKGTKIETVQEDMYLTIDELNAYLSEQHSPYIFLGRDAELLKDMLKGPTYYCIPRSAEMRRLVGEDTLVKDIHQFAPTYLRLSEAERNWQAQQI